MIHLGGFINNMLDNLDKKVITNSVIFLARANLPGLVSNWASNALNKFDIKAVEEGGVTAGKGFALFTSNEDMKIWIKMFCSTQSFKQYFK